MHKTYSGSWGIELPINITFSYCLSEIASNFNHLNCTLPWLFDGRRATQSEASLDFAWPDGEIRQRREDNRAQAERNQRCWLDCGQIASSTLREGCRKDGTPFSWSQPSCTHCQPFPFYSNTNAYSWRNALLPLVSRGSREKINRTVRENNAVILNMCSKIL